MFRFHDFLTISFALGSKAYIIKCGMVGYCWWRRCVHRMVDACTKDKFARYHRISSFIITTIAKQSYCMKHRLAWELILICANIHDTFRTSVRSRIIHKLRCVVLPLETRRRNRDAANQKPRCSSEFFPCDSRILKSKPFLRLRSLYRLSVSLHEMFAPLICRVELTIIMKSMFLAMHAKLCIRVMASCGGNASARK